MNLGLAAHILSERAAPLRGLAAVPDPPDARLQLPRVAAAPALADDAVVSCPRTDNRLRVNATTVLGPLGWTSAALTARIRGDGVVEVTAATPDGVDDVTAHPMTPDAQGRLVLSPTVRAHLRVAPREQVLAVAYPTRGLLLLAGLATGLSDLLRVPPAPAATTGHDPTAAPADLPAAPHPRGPRPARSRARA